MYLRGSAFTVENKTEGRYGAASGKRPAVRRGQTIETSGVGRNGMELAVELVQTSGVGRTGLELAVELAARRVRT